MFGNEPSGRTAFISKIPLWWSYRPGISLALFKMFLTILLLIELQGLMVPEQNILATPELISIVRQHPSTANFFLDVKAWLEPSSQSSVGRVPDLTEWFMPGLNERTAEYYVEVLTLLR